MEQKNGSSEENAGSGLSSSLKRHYEMVGNGLLAWEASVGGWRSSSEEQAEKDFQAAVSFVPVEVLESFLEDLLDVKVPDRTLYITREHSRGVLAAFTLGILAALAAGYQASLAGASDTFSFLLSASLGITVILLWQKYAGPHRRLTMANVLSREISRRRGVPSDGTVSRKIRNVISAQKAGVVPEST